MYIKLLIQFFVIIFGINCAVVGIAMHRYRLVMLSVVNIVALFVVLLQNRALFVPALMQERILFSREVFCWLAVWFGPVVTYLFATYASIHQFLLLAFLWWWLFFLVSGSLFRMTSRKTNTWLAVALCCALLVWSSWWLARDYGTQLAQTKQQVITMFVWRWDQLKTLFASPSTEEHMPVPKQDNAILSWWVSGAVASGNSIEAPVAYMFDRTDRADQPLTYASFLPDLVKVLWLTAAPSAPTFAHVPTSSALYEPFRIAYALRMIGSYTHPANQLKCKHVMVLLWLWQKRTVLPAETVFDAYWQVAEQKWYLTWACTDQENLAHWADLP